MTKSTLQTSLFRPFYQKQPNMLPVRLALWTLLEDARAYSSFWEGPGPGFLPTASRHVAHVQRHTCTDGARLMVRGEGVSALCL